MMAVAIVITVSAVLLYKSHKPQNKALEEHFNKIGDSFYKDNDETSIHEPALFFVSNVSTLAFFSTVVLYLTNNYPTVVSKLNFTRIFNTPFTNLFAFPYLEIINFIKSEFFDHSLTSIFIFPYIRIFSFLSIEIFIFYMILIFLALIIVYVLSISFGRLAISLGKRDISEGITLAIIIWMFTTLGIVIIITSYL